MYLFFRFFVFWNGTCASWIITLISVERFLAIYFPIQTKTTATRKKAALILVVTVLLMAALNLHFFWTYKVKQDKDGKHCRGISTYSTFLKHYWPWLTLAFYSLLPFTILLCSSTAIILKFLHCNYRRRHNFNQGERQVKLTSLTRTLLTVSFMFIVTTGPIVIYRSVFIENRFSNNFLCRVILNRILRMRWNTDCIIQSI